MTDYVFKTNHFAMSQSGIHLLRSNYNYKTVDLTLINAIEIKRGPLVNNWIILLFFGIALFGFGLFTAFKIVWELFFAHEFYNIYIEQILLPLFPLLVGAYCLFYALKRGEVLWLTVEDKPLKLPLDEFKKKYPLQNLIDFFAENENTTGKLAGVNTINTQKEKLPITRFSS